MLSNDFARWTPLVLVFAVALGLASCGDDDPGPEPGGEGGEATSVTDENGQGGATAQSVASGDGGGVGETLASGPEAPTEPLVIVGIVRDENGRPAANRPVGGSPRLMGLGGPLKDMGPRLPVRTVTDERGHFELRVPRAMTLWIGPLVDSNRALPEGETELFGYPTRVVIDADEPVAPLEFSVRPGQRLRGRVKLDEDLLRAMDPTLLRVKGTGERTGIDVTSKVLLDGSFELWPLDDETFSLVASADTFVGVPQLGIAADAEDVVLELATPRALRIDATGPGSAGARGDFFRDGASPLEWSKNLLAGRSERYLLDGPHTVVVSSVRERTVGVARVESTGTIAEPVVVEVELQAASSLQLSNDTDGPRIIVATLADLPVLAWPAAVGRQHRAIVPVGDLVVREYDLAGNELGARLVTAQEGRTIQIKLPLED